MVWKTAEYSGWGRVHKATGELARPEKRSTLEDLLSGEIVPAIGNCRSYGDACLNNGGKAIDMTRLDRFLAFDADTGILTAEAGLMLGEISRIMAPKGWLPAVMPGTGFATVGGAIAQDVHGKNHHHAGAFTAHPGGFASSVELIEALAETGRFEITVGAYPDPHPEAASDDADILWLKRKIDAGATRAITQFFFEADTYFRFRERAERAGITVPILPGILPIQSWSGTQKIAERCGARIPDRLARAFSTAERDNRTELLAIAECTHLCSQLIDGGADHLHFYTLNNPVLTRDVVHALGLAPDPALANVA